MPVTYDQPVRYDHPGVSYDGTIVTVNDGNSRPATTSIRTSTPTVVGQTSSRPEVS